MLDGYNELRKEDAKRGHSSKPPKAKVSDKKQDHFNKSALIDIEPEVDRHPRSYYGVSNDTPIVHSTLFGRIKCK